MAIVLAANQYGKAKVRLLHVSRDDPAHAITDLSVSVALSGDLTAAHLSGDNSAVLTTDAQKNTVFAFAKEHGVGEIEDFALLLARHFVASQPAISFARVTVEQFRGSSWPGTPSSGQAARCGPRRSATTAPIPGSYPG